MKQIITTKLKIVLSKEDSKSFLQTIISFKEAVNYLIEQNKNDKCSNSNTIQSKFYQILRNSFNLSSQMACSVSKTCSSIYKTMWSRLKTQKDKAIFTTLPEYKQLTANYVMNRNISIKTTEMTCSITTNNGRIKDAPLKGWKQHYNHIRTGKLCDPKITYDKSTKTFYLLIPVEVDIDEKPIKQIVGIDAGQRTALTCVSTTDKIKTYDIPETTKQQKTKISKLRGTLQSKGTRSAKQKLVQIAQRERRLISDVSHCLSKQVVSDFKDALLVMEDLTGIRNRTKTYRKDKESRRQVEQWNFAELQFKMTYKSILYNGIEVVYIDPAYTSQTCPVCSNVSSKNRPNGSVDFKCTNCGYENNADIVGAMNIKLKGQLINLPNVQTFIKSLGASSKVSN